MPIVNEYFKSAGPTAWLWPLQVGLPGKSESLQNQLQRFYWAKELSDINLLEQPGKHVNLAFFNEGTRKAVFTVREIYFHTDVIFILEDIKNIIDSKRMRAYSNSLQYIAEKTRAKGVFVFSTDKDISEWFEHFIIELSHNKNVIDALKENATDGYFYYDPKLETETLLSYLVEGLIRGLREGIKPLGATLHIISGITGDKNFTPPELAEYLEKQAPGFIYDSERHEASGIAAITKVLYKYYEPGIFHQHVKTGIESKEQERSIPARTTNTENNRQMERGMAEMTMEPVNSNSLESPNDAEGESIADYPRFLQVQIREKSNPTILKEFLKRNKWHSLQVRIGIPDSQWIKPKSGIFPSFKIFEKSKKQEEPIKIIFTQDEGQKLQEKIISLPRFGNSTAAGFTFKTPASGNIFSGEIYAYHKNRLIQKIRLKAPLDNNTSPAKNQLIQIEVVFCARKKLDNPEARMTFGSSLSYNMDEGNGGTVTGIIQNDPVSLNISPALSQLMNDIKKEIEQAVIAVDQYPQDIRDPNNVSLLRRLAVLGNSLYANHLKRKKLAGPLQIVTNRDEFVPLDFIYTLPSPDEASDLCPQAVQALKEGVCRNCMDKKKSPALHICPFGFLGLSQVIERHGTEKPMENRSGDYSITAEPSAGRNVLEILKNTLYASTERVDAASPGLRQTIREFLVAHAGTLTQVDTWEYWKKITQEQNPDTQILLVHVEGHPSLPADRIEIGADFLLQNNMDDSRIKPDPARQSPLMIVIGCETANLKKHGFDISSQLINYGAAIVLSNFTKIRGRQAGPILMKLVEFLKEQEKKEMIFGEVILRLKQHLLSEGIVVALALVAHGDADWKIKT